MANSAETTSSAARAEPLQRVRWLDRALDVALGIAWWGVLLVHQFSRAFLLNHEPLGVAFTLLRVVGIVSLACLFFRFAYRRRPRLSALTAIACLWSGAAAFLATGGDELSSPEEVLDAFVVLPWMFIASAWYVVLPMTALTASVLRCAERARRRGFTSPAAPHRAAA